MLTGICKCEERIVSLNERENRISRILVFKGTDWNSGICIEKMCNFVRK
jgi:hypothetical protein